MLIPSLLVTGPAVPIAVTSLGQQAEPYVLFWPQRPEDPRPIERRTEVGLVYTPAALAALTAHLPGDAVPPRIAQAIQDRTPIVVLWEFAESGVRPKPTRPYDVRIVDPPEPHVSIAPVWIQQNAAGLQDLDPRISSEVARRGAGVGIAAMAAFPRDAFVPGRIVSLESQRMKTEHGSWIHERRYGAIESALLQALAR